MSRGIYTVVSGFEMRYLVGVDEMACFCYMPGRRNGEMVKSWTVRAGGQIL